jgi:hypothetical protein
MPDKFIVPQFIDKEDQILGPITVRQFLLMLFGTFVLFIDYVVFKLNVAVFALIAILDAALIGLFAFVKIDGQPFHIFFVNFLETSVRPKLRVWDKRPTPDELRVHLGVDEHISAPMTVVKAKPRPERSRLRDLTLVVNTGGTYRPDDAAFDLGPGSAPSPEPAPSAPSS